MDGGPPIGHGGGNLRNEYAVIPAGASFLAGEHMPEGPGYNTERGVEQGPRYTLESPTSTCTLTVVGPGRVSVQHTSSSHNGVDSQKSYDRVSGFIVTSHNIAQRGPARDFEVKIVYIAGIYDQLKKTESIWNTQSLCVLPTARITRVSFFRWVEAQGLDVIDDQY